MLMPMPVNQETPVTPATPLDHSVVLGMMDQAYGFSLKRAESPEEAQDITQEILYQAIKSLPNLRDPLNFNGWFWRIAHNVFNQHLRKKYRRMPEASMDDDQGFERENLFEVANEQDQEQLGLIYRELSLLSNCQPVVIERRTG